MYDAASVLLREYYRATGWDEQRSYLYLTAASNVPAGTHVSLSAMPSNQMHSSARLLVLPLSGSVAYAYASTQTPMDLQCTSSIERRLVRASEFLLPKYIVPRETQGREMLMYGNMHLPSTCIDAVFATRLSPTSQILVTALSTAPSYPIQNICRWFGIKHKPPALPGAAFGPPGTTGLQVLLQKMYPCTAMEYSYSLDDALWGIRALRTLSWPNDKNGTLSVGAELFFSPAAKSAGRAAPRSAPLPAAATVAANPIMGHVRMAYAAMVTKDLSVCTRYDINVYSYESDLVIGAEYLLRNQEELPDGTEWMRESDGVWAPAPNTGLSLREPHDKETGATAFDTLAQPKHATSDRQNTMLGLIKGRISTAGIVALLWEGRWRQCIMSVGLKTRMQPSRKMLEPVLGLELMYIGDGAATQKTQADI